MGEKSARFHGIVNGESLCCLLCTFYRQTTPISKTLGQFESFVFVIMSTGENTRHIAGTSFREDFIFAKLRICEVS